MGSRDERLREVFGLRESNATFSNPERQQPALFEDFTVRKHTDLQSGTVQKVPTAAKDIVNKEYADSLAGGGVSDGDKGDISVSGSGATWTIETNFKKRTLTFVIDGGGSTITTGAKKAYVQVPFGCTITGYTVLADQSGSIVLDLWKDTYANYPPTVADTITASAKPTISSATKTTSTTLTGWTTTISADDILEVNVDSVTTLTKVVLFLFVTVTA